MPNILVVDDIESNIHLLTMQLSDANYNVVAARSGGEALELTRQQEFDLVLLDVMMPGMNGLELLSRLKKEPTTNNIPVILVTANSDDENIAQGLDLGCHDYITKPYSLVVLMARVRAALREKERLDLLEKWATTDPLTGIFNRRHFFELASREFERTHRGHTDLTFIMLDVDHFKCVNDDYGHQAGDLVLIALAQLLVKQLRKVDFCGRFGGEEFVVCLPDTAESAAYDVAERIRKASAEMVTATPNATLKITISLGTAAFDADSRLEDIIKRADNALYEAKEGGRNLTKTSGL